MKRNQLALELGLTPVQLDQLLSKLPDVDPTSDDIPDSVVEMILSKTKRIQQAPSTESITTTKDALAHLEQLIDGYRENSVDYVRGLEQQAIREEAFLGKLLGKRRALARLDGEVTEYEDILTEVSLARSESTLDAIEIYLDEISKATSKTQERIEKANKVLGKFEEITGLG